MKKENVIDHHSASIQIALEELFFCNFYISLSDYSFKVYKAQPYMTELLASCEKAIDAANSYVKYMVADESKEEMKAFLDMITLQQRLKDTNVLECIYHDPNIGWSKAVFTVVDRNEAGDAETVALVVQEISQKKEMSMIETHRHHSLETESKLWNSVKKLIAAENIEKTTNTIICDIMEYYDGDRAYIFTFDWKKGIGINTHEVCAPNVEPVIDTLQEVPLEAMDVWIKLFEKNSLILIKDLNELVGDENRKDEYDILAPQGIQSLIAAPVYFEGKLVGFLGVDNPKNNLDDIAYIKNLAFFCVNVSVREKEREILEEKNMLDPLTKVYNRLGYDEIIRRMKSDKRPIAYAQIDIDHFKNINDTYGHGVGDEVLKLVASQLKETFRSDDYVVRYGGDEFVVFLTNYRPETWENIGDKLRMIHMQMNLILKKEIYVTLSVGIGWLLSGFTDEIISLADAALYQVKEQGRAGCCVFDMEQHILYEWKDEIEDNSKGNILEQSNTGACRVEFPKGDVSQGRLICNETARSIMGFDENLTPEECLRLWSERIDPYYKEDREKAHWSMIENGQMEWTYLYHHPIWGSIMVRSGGRCQKTKEGIVFYGYHQSLQGTKVFLHEDDSQKLIDAMLSSYFASYYVDLQKDRLFTFKATPEAKQLQKQDAQASVAIDAYIQTLIKPEHREMMKQFANFSTMSERLTGRDCIEAEFQSEIIDKGWCRVRVLAVKKNQEGMVTHVQILLASIDQKKKAQLDQEKAKKNALELQLQSGELVAKTTIQHVGLIDRKTGSTRIYMNGIVSQDAITVPFEEMRRWGVEHAYPLDAALVDKKFALPYIEKEIEKNGNCTMAFRRLEKKDEVITVIHHYELYKADSSKILFVVEDVTKASKKGIGRIEEFDILEHLAESVTVFDYDTYEIVYVNKTVRDALGMSMSEFRGKKCYELFCGRSEPCDFCDKIILDQGQDGFMCRTVEATNELNFLHGCAIEVAGRKYRLEQALSLSMLCDIEPRLQSFLENAEGENVE